MRQQVGQFPDVPDFMAGSTPIWIKDLVAAVGWVGFLSVGVVVLWTEFKGHTQWRRKATHFLLLYVIIIAGSAGILRKELWPFSAWSMIPNLRDPRVGTTRVFGVDSSGHEHSIDVRAWHPIQWAELTSWLTLRFPALPEDEQVEAMRYLLWQANGARDQARRGEQPGYLGRYLGPLVAPEHLLHVTVWAQPDVAPSAPFQGLNVIREWWNVDTGRSRPDQVARDTIVAFGPSESR